MTSDSTYAPVRKPVTRRLPIRGADYAVTEWGDRKAPLLVYLHGFGDCGATFQFVVDALAEDWFVVAPDWRGFGATEVAAAAFWFPDYLADLVADAGSDQCVSEDAPGAGAVVTLDASGSEHVSGKIVDFRWSRWPDGRLMATGQDYPGSP